jgi:hypothetical protein
MQKLKILICGDSFAASRDPESWTSLLAQSHDVTGHGWKGCGEYKIYQQLKIQHLDAFDLALISHTSATRVHINAHPLYQLPHEHAKADLIYNDVCYHRQKNVVLDTAARYFEQIFDIEYYEFVHSLILDRIGSDLSAVRSLHLFPLYVPSVHPFEHWLDIRSIVVDNPGSINHCSNFGNWKIFESIMSWIEKNY